MNKWGKRHKYDTCESTIELDRISMFLAVTREIKKWNCGQTLWHITISSIQPTGISIDTTIHKMTHFMALLQLNFVLASSSSFSMKKNERKTGRCSWTVIVSIWTIHLVAVGQWKKICSLIDN